MTEEEIDEDEEKFKSGVFLDHQLKKYKDKKISNKLILFVEKIAPERLKKDH